LSRKKRDTPFRQKIFHVAQGQSKPVAGPNANSTKPHEGIREAPDSIGYRNQVPGTRAVRTR
jgi:hypothetical protein